MSANRHLCCCSASGGLKAYTPGRATVPGIELAGQALNKNGVAVMPKNQWGWYNSVIAGNFLLQNLETRIHTFLGRLETVRCAVCLLIPVSSVISRL